MDPDDNDVFLTPAARLCDSLVGLTRKQIVGFDLKPSAQIGFVEAKVRDRMNAAMAALRAILEAGDDMLPGMNEVVGNAIMLSDMSTLKTLSKVGLIDELVEGAEVCIVASEVNKARKTLREAEHIAEVAKWHDDLWDLLHSDARFEFASERTPGTEGDDEEDVGPVYPAASVIVAFDPELPLLVDDRWIQMQVLAARPHVANTAFGSSQLLIAMHEANSIDDDELGRSVLSLCQWRYRFIIPPPSVLLSLAANFKARPPGDDLRSVCRYMRDPGLFSGREMTTPPTSLAIHVTQKWLELGGQFVVQVWHDDRFNDNAARALTRWVVSEFMPSPPMVAAPTAQVVLFSNARDVLFLSALYETCHYQDYERSNVAMASIAEAFELDANEYDALITRIINSVAG